jgi:hypothetical protein
MYYQMGTVRDKKLICGFPCSVALISPSRPTSTAMSAPSIKSKDVYEEALPTDKDELQLVKPYCPRHCGGRKP